MLARTIALEAGKPLTQARAEAARCRDTLIFSAVEARRLAGRMVPMEGSAAGRGRLGMALREPIGVVGAIAPFNFPLNLVAHKVAPAIAAGCPVVLEARRSHPALRPRPGPGARGRRPPPGRPDRRGGLRRHGGQRDRRPPGHRADLLHGQRGRGLGDPRPPAAQGGRAGARQLDAGDRGRGRRPGPGRRAGWRRRASPTRASPASRSSASTPTAPFTTPSSSGSSPASAAWWSATPWTRRRTSGRSSTPTPGSASWPGWPRRPPPAPRC